jgi:hypothetical protein
MRRAFLIATALFAGLGAAPASAESARLADFSLGLTGHAPGSPTGMAIRVLFHRAGDPNAKPPALRSAVIRAPSGLRFDSGAVSECTASDAEIRVLGSNACPAASRLTVGPFSAMTGFGPPIDPLTGDDHVFNGANQLIEVITAPGTTISPAFDRLTISGSTLTAHPPSAPGGPPDGQTAVRSIAFAIPVRAAGGRSLITAPPACPAAGMWTSTGTFGFADGTADTVVSTTPCTRSLRKHRRHARPHRIAARHR